MALFLEGGGWRVEGAVRGADLLFLHYSPIGAILTNGTPSDSRYVAKEQVEGKHDPFLM